MQLSVLLERITYEICQGSTQQEVSSVVFDSRKVS